MEQTVREAPLGKLAAFAASLSWDRLPETVQQAAVYRALDLISVALGAVGDPLVERMKQALRALDPENRRTGVALLGQPLEERWSVTEAAMLDAMLAHTLELDDVHPGSKTHISSSMIPAAWCLGHALGSTGKDFWRPTGNGAGMPRPPAVRSGWQRPVPICWVSMRKERLRPWDWPVLRPRGYGCSWGTARTLRC